ncbi:MAG: glycosyltransferase [Sedimentisphaerales bacterium]|nr:glycosyltransferase [Sedimentisphaerales bacterium]
MSDENLGVKSGPLVSVLIPTYNRAEYLREALGSAVRQDYSNIEILVIRDGGDRIDDVIRQCNDSRVVFINRDENRGIAFTLNEGLARAAGKYICYLGNDDLYYRHHVGTLVNALEDETDCGVAYSDLYRTYCRIRHDGTREVLSKVVEVSRDFDRFVMLYFNHALHVSLMHRRELVEKIGRHNEELNVLIDWDLTRKLCFFTDFYHVNEVTGEYYSPVGESDRVSVQRRKDANAYLRNVLTIRTTRPPKPWPKIKDVSIILLTEQLNQQVGGTLASMWRHTFYPYEVYLPLPQADLARLDVGMPNIVTVPVEAGASPAERVNAALTKCGGEYTAVVPNGLPMREFWLEDSLYSLIESPLRREALELEDSTDELWAVVSETDNLRDARGRFPGISVRDSLNAAGIKVRRVQPDEIPFQFDQLLCQSVSAGKDGDWLRAGRILERIAGRYGNELWMKQRAAEAYFKAGEFGKAGALARQVNDKRPTVDSLLLGARLKRLKNEFREAIVLLEEAERILEGKELVWT